MYITVTNNEMSHGVGARRATIFSFFSLSPSRGLSQLILLNFWDFISFDPWQAPTKTCKHFI